MFGNFLIDCIDNNTQVEANSNALYINSHLCISHFEIFYEIGHGRILQVQSKIADTLLLFFLKSRSKLSEKVTCHMLFMINTINKNFFFWYQNNSTAISHKKNSIVKF